MSALLDIDDDRCPVAAGDRMPPANDQEPQPAARYSGAAIASDHLVIATVEGGGGEGFRLCLDQSVQIELEGRDQQSLLRFQDHLRSFFEEVPIRRVLVRELAVTGPHRTKLGLKLEAMLQLMPAVEVELVHFATIQAWQRHSGQLAPEPVEGLQPWQRNLHAAAIAVACLGEMRPSHPVRPAEVWP